MNQMIMDSLLQFQDTCPNPECHAFYPAIEDSLKGWLGSENYDNAMHIVLSCKVCEAKFHKLLRRG